MRISEKATPDYRQLASVIMPEHSRDRECCRICDDESRTVIVVELTEQVFASLVLTRRLNRVPAPSHVTAKLVLQKPQKMLLKHTYRTTRPMHLVRLTAFDHECMIARNADPLQKIVRLTQAPQRGWIWVHP